METENIFLALINKLPIWFIISLIVCYGINKFCNSNIKIITKILSKHKIREEKKDREQDDRIDRLETKQNHIITELSSIKKDIMDILNILTK